MVTALSWQLRAQCRLVYLAKEEPRCITIIWNRICLLELWIILLWIICIWFRVVLINRFFLTTFQREETVSSMAMLGKSFCLQHSQLIRKDLLQHFISMLRKGYFWGTGTEQSCQNHTFVVLESSGASSRAQERVTHTTNELENNG